MPSLTAMGGKPFGKPARIGKSMPKAPDGKTLPAGLPKEDRAMSKRHRVEAIAFHKQHAAEHLEKAKEHRAALKDSAYQGVSGTRPTPRPSLVHLIAIRQDARDGSKAAPLRKNT